MLSSANLQNILIIKERVPEVWCGVDCCKVRSLQRVQARKETIRDFVTTVDLVSNMQVIDGRDIARLEPSDGKN